VLAESIREHNPDLPPLLVLLADKVDGCFDPSKEPFQMIQLEDLSDKTAVRHMSFYYTPFEFCCALRAYLHEYIFEKTNAESWMFLDSDILVLNSLSPIFERIKSNSILLTPHITRPVESADDEFIEINLLHAGLYNAGFLGLNRHDETSAFIKWFCCRLQQYAFDNNALFFDQAWLNLVPIFFQDVYLLKDLGINLGHWNLQGHVIGSDEGRFLVDGIPISFFHFSGWDPAIPHIISKYHPRLDSDQISGWIELATEYASKLKKWGYEETNSFPYAFSKFDDGHDILKSHRRFFYHVLTTKQWTGESPFKSKLHFCLNAYHDRSLWKRYIKWLRRND
jgi:hypothetical protein